MCTCISFRYVQSPHEPLPHRQDLPGIVH
jgi:hypothetical protein